MSAFEAKHVVHNKGLCFSTQRVPFSYDYI